jgi:methyltransferase-like protein/cyclopropane fatty-acyl-phospholipid synthase-like methyltransferase
MSAPPVCTYDELPYVNRAFYYTHPEWMATVAALWGMETAPPQRCRVLELGCAAGANLLPMAQALPDSRFVGIDLSPRQIASGQAVVDELGLRNVELKPLSILDIDEGFGQFDYILCHGVYAWVPPEVQDKILSVCKTNLAPQGIAYISYNTYPGWHFKGVVRDLMCYHARSFAGPLRQVQQARVFLDFLAKSVSDTGGPYHRLLAAESASMARENDAYVFHDYLEDYNQPLYFHEFMARAQAKGLQYVEEARANPKAIKLPQDVQQTVQQLSVDRIQREQLLDFLCLRSFRRTLLCHQEVALAQSYSPAVLQSALATLAAQPTGSGPDILSDTPAEFRTADGVCLRTNRPLVKAAMWSLAEIYPQSASVSDLSLMVQERLQPILETDASLRATGSRQLAEFLLQGYLSDLLELHLYVPPFLSEVSERPQATPLARIQARTESRVINQRHRGVELSDFDRLVLQQLDGRHDRAALRELLVEAVLQGEFTVQRKGEAIKDAAVVRQLVAETLEPSLQGLVRNAFLVA